MTIFEKNSLNSFKPVIRVLAVDNKGKLMPGIFGEMYLHILRFANKLASNAPHGIHQIMFFNFRDLPGGWMYSVRLYSCPSDYYRIP